MFKKFIHQRSIANNVSGFTLIEMVIVIGVLAILAVLVLLIINPFAQFQKADDAKRKEDLSQIQRALEQYYQDNGVYPTGFQGSNGGQTVYEITNPQLTPIPWGSSWTPYMDVLPSDSNGRSYEYISTGQKYWIYTSLERGGADTQACKNTNTDCQADPLGSSCQCGGVPNNIPCGNNDNICTYGVSSPNTTP